MSFVLEFAQVTNKQDKAAQSSALKYILGFSLWNILLIVQCWKKHVRCLCAPTEFIWTLTIHQLVKIQSWLNIRDAHHDISVHCLYEPRWPRNEIYIVSKSKFLMMLIDYKAGIYIWCHIWWSRCESKVWWIKVHLNQAFLSVSSVSVHCMCRLCFFLLLQTDFCNAFLYCSLNTSPGISLIPKFSPRKYSGHASSQLSPRALHLGTCSHPFKVKSK